jgi:hypothetical protein
MPDATGPVRLAPLRPWPAIIFGPWCCSRPNWQRLRPGHYEVDEDFLLLQR